MRVANMPNNAKELSFEEIIRLAQAAGVPISELATCAAIAAAESGRRPDNVGVNGDGSRDRGLWQINSKAHPNVSDACAFDPTCAAKAMYEISNKGTKWRAWVAYKNGSYKKFLFDALKAQRKVLADLGYQERSPILFTRIDTLCDLITSGRVVFDSDVRQAFSGLPVGGPKEVTDVKVIFE